jgi:hypothetical protein
VSERNQIPFNQTFSHPVTFRPELLDTWWTTDFVVKVLSRSMKQRESTLIGEASIGLKYLLTNSENSNGSVLKLPIYASSKFSREQNISSEIIGDLHIAFTLQKSSSEFRRNVQGRPVSPRTAVRDGEPDEQPQESFPTSENSKSTQNGSSKITEDELSQTEKIFGVHDRRPFIDDRDYIFCLLKVKEGRNFARREDYTNNLYLTCRFMTSSDIVTSEVAWNTTNPKFNMMHYVPLKLDQDFLTRCKDNFLVIEVWNLRDEKHLIGVAMVPLHQFYLSFRVSILVMIHGNL